jgi:hypothetical protein
VKKFRKVIHKLTDVTISDQRRSSTGGGAIPAIRPSGEAIRVPSGMKRSPDANRFPTLEETPTNAIVAALEKMHDGTPVPAAQISSAVGMGHQQALIDLHKAADEAGGKPVGTRNGEVPRGRPTVERRPAILVASPLIDRNSNECGECLDVNKCVARAICAHQNNGNAMHA